MRAAGRNIAPAPTAASAVRRSVSGAVMALLRFGRKRNLMTSSGQAISQFMHMWHSSCRHFTPPCGLVGALAVDEAQVAVGALRVVLLHPEEREAGEDAEERAERAEDAAPEARDEAVREEDRDEQEDDEPGLVEVELLATARPSARGSPARGRRRAWSGARRGRPAPRRGRGAARYCAAGMTPRPMERTAMQIGSKRPPIALPRDAPRRGTRRAGSTSRAGRCASCSPRRAWPPRPFARREDPPEEVVERAERADPAAEHAAERRA